MDMPEDRRDDDGEGEEVISDENEGDVRNNDGMMMVKVKR